MLNALADSNIWEIVIRTTVSFSVLLLLTRLMGKKQLSQLTYFNYVTGIAIGTLAADIVKAGSNFVNDMTGLVWWTFLTFLVGYLSLKSAKLRILFDGEPTIVIKKGKILEKALARARLNMDDLSMLLRNKNVFSIKDVDYAILEPDGKLSVLKKENKEPPTREDLELTPPKRMFMPSELVVDGKVVDRNMKELGLNAVWLDRQLQRYGSSLARVQDIFYAELQSDGTVHVDKREDLFH